MYIMLNKKRCGSIAKRDPVVVSFHGGPFNHEEITMNFISTVGAMIIVALTFSHQATADEALAKSKGCLNCHGIENKIVGPAYTDVAKKYQGQNVTDQLADKVMKGGGGVWGGMAMPPNAVTPDEAKQLVTWVLGLK